MPLFLTRNQRKDSASSADSSINGSSTLSWQTWYRKRKTTSPSRSHFFRHDSLTSEGSSTDSKRTSTRKRDRGVNGSHTSQRNQEATAARLPSPAQESVVINQVRGIQQGNTTLPREQNHGIGQPEQNFGLNVSSRPAGPGRRRSSTRFSAILPPKDFTAKELEQSLVLSQPSCPCRVGRVHQRSLELGWRVKTKPRSPESCFTTNRPLYSARRHSPLVTGRSYTIYFECEITPGSSEDSVCLALGFIAGRDRASLMPGSERGSIGIQCRDGRLHVNNKLFKEAVTAAFEPGQQVGIGMTFSKRDCDSPEVDDAPSSTVSAPTIDVEVFLSRDGKKVASWNMRELAQAAALPLEGLEGAHDLYAAVGTLREVDVGILFDKRDWKYKPNKMNLDKSDLPA